MLAVLSVCVFITVSLTGCGASSSKNQFTIYYVNQERTALAEYKTKLDESADAQALVNEMDKARKKSTFIPARPAYVKVDHVQTDGQNVYIYYTDTYKSMDNATEVLYRAAVVKTLTQLPEVDHVMFYVDGAPATYADGTVIGMMSADDFVEASGSNSADIQSADIKLYFANAKGDKLIPMDMNVTYNKNVPIERVVVEQLINGPGISGYYRTLPANVKLLGISVTDGTCYVNLDSTFIDGMVNAAEMVPVYSIVNSLCDIPQIDRVQILINGESNRMYRESISLETKFTNNEDIVQKTGE
jgi:germination protein M